MRADRTRRPLGALPQNVVPTVSGLWTGAKKCSVTHDRAPAEESPPTEKHAKLQPTRASPTAQPQAKPSRDEAAVAVASPCVVASEFSPEQCYSFTFVRGEPLGLELDCLQSQPSSVSVSQVFPELPDGTRNPLVGRIGQGDALVLVDGVSVAAMGWRNLLPRLSQKQDGACGGEVVRLTFATQA